MPQTVSLNALNFVVRVGGSTMNETIAVKIEQALKTFGGQSNPWLKPAARKNGSSAERSASGDRNPRNS